MLERTRLFHVYVAVE